MLTYLTNLRNERDSLSATSSSILDKAAQEERAATDAEKASIAKMAERCAAIDEELKTFTAQYESQKAYAKLRAAIESADEKPERKELAVRKPADIERADVRAWGKLFVDSGEFRSYMGHGSTARIAVPGIFTRNPIDTSGIGGLPPVPYTATIPQPAITTPLLDAVGNIKTNSNLVQWLVQSGVYPQAAVVPEGSPKPEANITLDTETGTLQTYAHWKGITRQALANVPMIQSIVETQLRGGIFAKLEADIAAALAAATIGGVVTPAEGGMLAAIRNGIAQVQLQGFPNANSVLLNPADWASLDVSVFDATNNGPSRQSGFWGLRPIASAAVPVGTAYVGDLNAGVTVFDEGQASVFMTDSHSDFFIKNVILILAEVMALVMVTQPGALARITPAVPPGA